MGEDGGPAFPVECSYDDATGNRRGGVQTGPRSGFETGMTLRDWFAGQALSGYLADPNVGGGHAEYTAERCYVYADAMLKARQK